MSANRLTVACCMRTSERRAGAIVSRVEAPRPLHRAGAEHAGRRWRAVQRQVVRRGAGAVGRAVVEQNRRTRYDGRRQPDQSRRTEAVVEILVPLVAERAVGQRRDCSGASVGDARVAPEAQLAVGRGHGDRRRRAGVDGEDRAGQRVLRPAAVGGRAEARIAPRAGPRRGWDRSSRWRASPCRRPACGRACPSRRCCSPSASSRTPRCR